MLECCKNARHAMFWFGVLVSRSGPDLGQGRLGTCPGASTKASLPPPSAPHDIISSGQGTVCGLRQLGAEFRAGQTWPTHQKGPHQIELRYPLPPAPRKKCVKQLTSPQNISCPGAPAVLIPALLSSRHHV